ncbi:hypothetical protein C9374_009946 [Naegleria lovaniensis]|uniref:Phosphatidylinositol-specific phospholipase C X domain-containing protein n=1 Tax=Naegleria lovaniensis TaxID=51637 RepID=A0AA88GHJ5_NAELO|nr:uncharacterized protein C9374_009946 [Naegleria lovaniensis]KAG2375323.1 hypothetical protein C9374_009946 [Naegleria lovaniensis]
MFLFICCCCIQESHQWAPTPELLQAETEFIKQFGKTKKEKRMLMKAFRVLKRWAKKKHLMHRNMYELERALNQRGMAHTLFLHHIVEKVKKSTDQVISKVKSEISKAQQFFNPPIPKYDGPFYSKGSLATWMNDLVLFIGDLPLNNLLIPGTHDSFTSKIVAESKIAPNAEEPIKKLNNVLKFYPKNVANTVIANWARAQSQSAYNQLVDGVRYLDIRLCRDKEIKDKVQMLKTCHTFFDSPIEPILDNIATFSKTKGKKEIIILDFNHLYDMDDSDHEYLFKVLKAKFGNLLADSTKFSPNSSLREFWRTTQRIIVLYDNENAVKKSQGLLWPQSKINSPWPNVQTTTDLYDKLSKSAQSRSDTDKQFFVSQGLLTPNEKTIAAGLIAKPKSLLDAGDLWNPVVANWIASGSLPRKKLNIVIVDNYSPLFVATLVEKNRKKI